MSSVSVTGKADFEESVLKCDKPVLVDFWAQWCGPCRSLIPILDEVAKEMGETVKVTKVNVDEESELAGRYGVRGIPTMLFFKDGEVKKTLVGKKSKEEIKKNLETLA